MMRRLVSRVGIAVVLAMLASVLAGPVPSIEATISWESGSTWAIGAAASMREEWDTVDSNVYGFFTGGICWGYAWAAGIAFPGYGWITAGACYLGSWA